MSGGHLDYISYKIDDLLVGKMEDPELDELMKDISQLTHDLEWYLSGDTDKEEYEESVFRFKARWFKTPREDRLVGIINERTAAVRRELMRMIGVQDEDPTIEQWCNDGDDRHEE